ncbi:molybdopterin-dependent oxidoreductase [Chloroflexota bacterium]
MEEKQSFCRLCAGRCGVRAMVDEGKLVSVAGDPDDPLGRKGTCNKGRAWPEVLNHPNRLRYPQKRIGEPGEGRWRRISWPEALDIIAERLEGYKNEYGPESLILALGEPKGLELSFAQRFASVFGTPNVSTPGHLCHIPRGLASTLTLGAPCVCDEQATPRCIIVWGNNFPDTHDTTMTPQHFNRAVGEGARLIVIDPRKTGLASRASLWLRPRPGTDDALAMGMLKVIVDEELYDRDFVAEWTVGFAELAEHLGKYSLSRIADITWLPEENIKKAARLYAQNRPGCIILGNALEHTANSIQALRAISILRAITGNLDVPGGELLVGRIPLDRPGHFMLLSKLPGDNNWWGV